MTLYRRAEDGKETVAYGVIKEMFSHSFGPEPDAEKYVIISADWYEHVSTNPINGLPQVRYQNNFDACSLAFLEDCIPDNCCFFRFNPWDPDCDLYDVAMLKHSSQL